MDDAAPEAPPAAPPEAALPDGVAFDPDWYREAYPDVVSVGLDPWAHWLEHGREEGRLPAREAHLLRDSGLFDAAFYVRHAPDVSEAGLDPLDHYLEHGAEEGRAPNAYVDPAWIEARHGPPAHGGALAHYLVAGEAAGQRPGPLFDPAWYRRTWHLPPQVNALAHYLAHRTDRTRAPNPGFDVVHYVRAQGDAIPSGEDPFEHYLAAAAAADLDPAPWFDAAGYRVSRMEGAFGQAALAHFLRGAGANPAATSAAPSDPDRPPTQIEATASLLASPLVDVEAFVAAFGAPPDEPAAIAAYLDLPPLRRPALCPAFDPVWYLGRHPGSRDEEPDPLLHFLSTGAARQLDPHPLIDLAWLAGRHPDAFVGRSPDAALAALLTDPSVDPSPYFSTAWYLGQVGEDAEATAAPLRHFLTVGIERNLTPNRYLDLDWVLRRDDSGARTRQAALRHFVLEGDARGLPPGPGFDGASYLQAHADVAGLGLPALRHFLEHGAEERRDHAPLHPRLSPRIERHAGDPADGPSLYRDIADAAHRRAVARRNARPAGSGAEGAPVRVATQAGLALSVIVLQAEPTAPTDPDAVAALRRALPHLLPGAKLRVATPGRGQLAAQIAAAAAAGNVLLLDADRVPERDALVRLVACLRDEPGTDIVGAAAIGTDGRIEEAGRTIDNAGRIERVAEGADPRAPGLARTRDVHAVGHGAVLIRSEALAAGWPGRDADGLVNLCLSVQLAGRRVRLAGAARVRRRAIVEPGLSADAPTASSPSSTPPADRIAQARQDQALARRWGELLGRLNQIRVIAFYDPRFHRAPETDRRRGRGYTEWIDVARAEPGFEGHYQPHVPADLGFYDLRVTPVFVEQARLAARYGIDGFCLLGRLADGLRLVPGPFEAVLRDRSIRFPFCVAWAEDHARPDAPMDDRAADAAIADAIRLARDPRYIAVDGRPVLVVRRPLGLPDPRRFAALCRERFREAGMQGVHLVACEGLEGEAGALDAAAIGFDAALELPPHGRTLPLADPPRVRREYWQGERFAYADAVLASIEPDLPPFPRHPGVFPSFDDTPRRPQGGIGFEGSDPARFQFYVERKLAELHRAALGPERLLFVNAWNGWAEGAHLEPDRAYGHRWLEALRAARETSGFQ